MAGAADQEILKEFLVSLGFKIDEAGAKKFREGLGQTTKDALALGGAVIGVGFAIEKFVESMADSYARLYYMSERTDASVEGIKATENAFRGVGLSAAAADEAIESVADKLRNPGTRSQLIGYGFNTNQPTEKIAADIEDWLAKLYKQVGTRPFAITMAKNLLGLNERDFAQLVKELPNLKQQQALSGRLQTESGVNYKELAYESAKFNRELNVIGQELAAIGAKWLQVDVVMTGAANSAHALAVRLERLLKGDFKHLWDPIQDVVQATPSEKFIEPKKKYSEEQLKAEAVADAIIEGLDPKLFLAQIQKESGFNPRAKSKAGALGIAQFMPQTAGTLGFAAGEDPVRDIQEMAKMMRKLMEKYHNYDTALRAYNAGETRVNAALRGVGPPLKDETQQYAPLIHEIAKGVKITPEGIYGVGHTTGKEAPKGDVTYSPTVNQTFNINGDNANEIGTTVADKTNRTHSEVFRDQVGQFAN